MKTNWNLFLFRRFTILVTRVYLVLFLSHRRLIWSFTLQPIFLFKEEIKILLIDLYILGGVIDRSLLLISIKFNLFRLEYLKDILKFLNYFYTLCKTQFPSNKPFGSYFYTLFIQNLFDHLILIFFMKTNRIIRISVICYK